MENFWDRLSLFLAKVLVTIALFIALLALFNDSEEVRLARVMPSMAIAGMLLIYLLLRTREASGSLFVGVLVIATVVAPVSNLKELIVAAKGRDSDTASGSDTSTNTTNETEDGPSPVSVGYPDDDLDWRRALRYRASLTTVAAEIAVHASPKQIETSSFAREIDSLREEVAEGKTDKEIYQNLKARLEANGVRIPGESLDDVRVAITRASYETIADLVMEERARFPLLEIGEGGESVTKLVDRYGEQDYFKEDMTTLKVLGLVTYESDDFAGAAITDRGRAVALILSGEENQNILPSTFTGFSEEFDTNVFADHQQMQPIEIGADPFVMTSDDSQLQHAYRFVVVNQGRYTIQVEGGQDLILALYSLPDAKLLGVVDDGPLSLAPASERDFSEGQYAFLIRELNGEPISTQYTVSVLSGALISEEAEMFPSQLSDAAKAEDRVGAITPNGGPVFVDKVRLENHLYDINITESGEYVIETEGETDMALAIYDDGQLLKWDDDSGDSFNPRLEVDLEPGQFVVVVRDVSLTFVNPNYSISATSSVESR